MSGYPEARVKEIAAEERYALVGGPFGSKLGRKDYEPRGVPVIRGANLPQDRRFSTSDFVYVSEEKADELKSNLAFPGDVVVTQRGTLGQVGLIPESAPYSRFVISQSQMKITVDSSKADNRFVYYAIRSPQVQHRILGSALTAGVPHINLGIFENLKIPAPSLTSQRKIAAILSVYDELIENNLRRIEILEEMAQAIYREWFGNLQFPGHQHVALVESELGSVPKGWSVQPFSKLADFVNGFAFKSAEHWHDSGLPIVKIKELKLGVTSDTPRYHGQDIPEKYHVGNGSLLFSWSADLGVYLWSGGDALLNQHLFNVIPTSGLEIDFLYHALRAKLPDFRARAQGTTMKHIKRSALTEVKAVVPDVDTRARFISHVRPLHQLVDNLVHQNRNLRVSRDLLLPKLISGEIDVSEVDIDASWLAA